MDSWAIECRIGDYHRPQASLKLRLLPWFIAVLGTTSFLLDVVAAASDDVKKKERILLTGVYF